MSPERWQRIVDLFEQALELDAGRREPFLDQACAGDEDLRRRVDELLAGHAETHEWLERSLVDLHSGTPDPLTGARIGPYRVLREIGRGGLGVVYLAERAEAFTHRVAVKVIKRGLDTDEVVRRFMVERQVLANLEHPNIARLLDGGTTAEGLPYFVMEHVEGEPLDRYCDTRKLGVEERLELFLQVSSAVHFAHRNLVVHRDLKPGNILVTGDGPKLLDFGIAKLLSREGAPFESLTAPGFHPMTPVYASPEQAEGRSVTTASDVYSLGVVLYELLTGRCPYRLDDCGPREQIRRICREEPKRPSAVAGPRRLGRRLAGDLDSIVLKALRKEPEHRYGSVEELAADLRRHLDGRPVLAHHGSWAYRMGKLVRRHTVAVAAALVLLLAATTVTVLWRRAVAERDRAESERRRAERVSAFLEELFQAPDPDRAKGEPVTARELLDHGLDEIRHGLDEEPRIRADLLQTMGRVYRRLGAYDEAGRLLAEALDVRRRTLGPHHPLVAESLHDLANVLRLRGDLNAATPLVVEAVAIQRRNAGERPLELARGLTILGALHYAAGRYEKAEAVLHEALDIKRRTPGEESDDLLVTLSNLAATRKMLGRTEEAVALYREVLEIRLRRHGRLHTRVARSLASLAAALQDLGRNREAEELLREALAIRSELQGTEHPDVAKAHRSLGTILKARGDLEAAGDEYRRALEIQRRSFRDDHPELAITRTRQAALLAAEGDLAACEALARRAVAALETSAPAASRSLADAERVLAECSGEKPPLGEGTGAARAPVPD